MDPMFFSRRHFLARGTQLLSAAATIPLFLDRSAYVMADAHPDTKHSERVLVVVQLAGGNDGLNTVIPVTCDEYYKARPKIAVAKDKALKLTDDFSAHTSAVGMKKLYDAGHLAILHAVGYPNPNRSHFRSTDIWTSGEPEAVVKSGWLGRYCDACCAGEDPGPGNAPAKKKLPDAATAIALLGDPPRALIGDNYVAMAFASPETLGFQKANTDAAKAAFDALNDDPAMAAPRDADHIPPAGASTEDTNAFLQRSALNARVYADRIRKLALNTGERGDYPRTAFGQDLKLIAQMIASDLPTRIYYAKLGGFDTHSGQVGHHDRLLGELFNALAAFTDDLAALGHLDRVTTMTFSEFGRRVKENGSGTDHGEAAPLFVVGAHLNPGFHGTFPDLVTDKLHRGDVPYTTDFRCLYATILRDWLNVDDTKILGKPFKRLDLFKA